MDDALETLFMNMIYHGCINSLPYKFSIFNGRSEVIRPLLEITNDELIKYARLPEYQKELNSYPYDELTHRVASAIILVISTQNKVAKKTYSFR